MIGEVLQESVDELGGALIEFGTEEGGGVWVTGEVRDDRLACEMTERKLAGRLTVAREWNSPFSTRSVASSNMRVAMLTASSSE